MHSNTAYYQWEKFLNLSSFWSSLKEELLFDIMGSLYYV